ncbi:hypothetical protein ODS41_02075 [Pyrobaculum sp. 3827-6]|uniref:hypothetical protein n=1 Tax=Pyrobaculum sp. 3827-6 TaxID=2983604 RepID=UPI0021D88BE5|nr:hypothetical protein [Pyrobaculum sp. 3827-6]MCU7786718.1 hypothetical protein [Pyrobaculum sp. 3827-6]
MRNPRGISGVVIAVLLTVIGIVAVLMFWGMFSGMFNPQPKVIIEKASITKIGDKTYDVSITVREVGGASTTILEAKLLGGTSSGQGSGSSGQGSGGGQDEGIPITFSTNQGSGQQGGQDLTLQAGQSKTLVGRITNQDLQPGVTYYLAVYYQKGSGRERTELYPVTVR